MDLSHPAYDIFGESEGRILHRLAVLSGGATGRRIHDLAGVNALRTTQRILRRLTEIGLVDVRAIGRSNEYVLNRGHVLWGPIERILALPSRIEEEIAGILAAAFDDRLVGAALYGSFARGEAGPDSDIDVLIVHANSAASQDLVNEIDVASERLRALTGNEAQLLPVSVTELRNLVVHGDPLVESLRRDARSLVEGFRLDRHLQATLPK
jgi:predicted nucleotidyltransferase